MAYQWTCFHCGETFVDPDKAQKHFGHYTIAPPTCVIGGKEYRQDEIEAFLLMRKRAEKVTGERDALHDALRSIMSGIAIGVVRIETDQNETWDNAVRKANAAMTIGYDAE